MAKCTWCSQEMLDDDVTSCEGNHTVLFPGDKEIPSIPYGKEERGGIIEHLPERCHDCNITLGGYHHPRCDVEECPECGCQLLSCGCLSEEQPDFQKLTEEDAIEIIATRIATLDIPTVIGYIMLLFEKVPYELHLEVNNILTKATQDHIWAKENKELVAAAERYFIEWAKRTKGAKSWPEKNWK